MVRRSMHELVMRLNRLAAWLRIEVIRPDELKRGIYLARDPQSHRYRIIYKFWRTELDGGEWVTVPTVFGDEDRTVTQLFDAVDLGVRLIQNFSLLPHGVIEERVALAQFRYPPDGQAVPDGGHSTVTGTPG